MPFSQLNNETQVNRLTTPMLVPLTQNPDDETREMLISRHNKFLKLPEKIKDKLASIETSKKIQSIGQKYGFELLRLANITRLIREYYFGEIRLEDFPREIEKRMSVSLLTAQEISRYLKQEIIDWDPWAEFLASLPKMPIREILKKYPRVGDQQISGGYIEIKGRDDLFDGTIRNWLQDYILHLGQANRSSVDRMNFLFHTENTKDLASTEREKLGIILKSFDENIPLPVDVENNEVVLEVSEPAHIPPKAGNEAGRQPIRLSEVKTSQPQKSDRESFIKPYPRTETKAPVQKANQSPAFPFLANTRNSSKPDFPEMRFANPYPQSGTHDMPDWKKVRRDELADEKSVASLDRSAPQREVISSGSGSPLVVKGMTTRQNIPGEETPQPKKIFQLPEEPSPRQYTPHHKKNFFEPISGHEPRIEGNVVDLSNKE